MSGLRAVLLFVFMFTFAKLGVGQIIDTANVVKAKGGCEMNSANADMISSELNSNANHSLVFVIAHAGSGESKVVNERRLRWVRNFLTIRKGWDKYKPVYALGDAVLGQGKIDVFIGSKLYWVIMALKNQGPCMDCCEFDRLTWPGYLVKKTKKKTRNSVYRR